MFFVIVIAIIVTSLCAVYTAYQIWRQQRRELLRDVTENLEYSMSLWAESLQDAPEEAKDHFRSARQHLCWSKQPMSYARRWHFLDLARADYEKACTTARQFYANQKNANDSI